jgi:hypothetical protein
MKGKHSVLRAGVASAITLGVGLTMAHATITFDLGNHPQPDEINILFGAPETGMTIHGAAGGIDVAFSSTVDTLFQKAEGQAEIFNTSNPPFANLTDVTVTPAESFTDFIVDLNKADGSTLDITVHGFGSDGTTPEMNNFSFTGKSGSNFITILASGGETMTSINFNSPAGSPAGWDQFKQPRISGLAGAVIPEISTWAMMALGFAGLGFAGYRKARMTVSTF